MICAISTRKHFRKKQDFIRIQCRKQGTTLKPLNFQNFWLDFIYNWDLWFFCSPQAIVHDFCVNNICLMIVVFVFLKLLLSINWRNIDKFVLSVWLEAFGEILMKIPSNQTNWEIAKCWCVRLIISFITAKGIHQFFVGVGWYIAMKSINYRQKSDVIIWRKVGVSLETWIN